MTEQAECSVSGSMSWMFRMSQLTGIAPVRFDGRRVSVSPTICYIHCVVMTVMNVTAIYALVNDLTVDFDHSIRVRQYAHRIIWTADFSVVMLIASVAVYGAPPRVTEILKGLGWVQKIKKSINCQSQDSAYFEKNKWALLVPFLVLSTICVFLDYYRMIFGVLRDGKDFLVVMMYFGYEASYIMVFMLEIQFLLPALEVYEAFKGLNDALERIFHLNSLQIAELPNLVVNINFPTKTVEETIHYLASTYNDLCMVIKRLEKAFGVALIILLMSCLLYMVIAPNHMVFLVITNKLKPLNITLEMSWCVLHLLRTVLIIEPSHLTQVQMDRTHLLVSQLILQNKDCLVSEELNTFYRYILLNKKTYTPMGICTVDRPLLASIMGSVVTYLVIIVQFQLLEVSDNYRF